MKFGGLLAIDFLSVDGKSRGGSNVPKWWGWWRLSGVCLFSGLCMASCPPVRGFLYIFRSNSEGDRPLRPAAPSPSFKTARGEKGGS